LTAQQKTVINKDMDDGANLNVVEKKENLVSHNKCLFSILSFFLGIAFICLIAYIVIFKIVLSNNESLILSNNSITVTSPQKLKPTPTPNPIIKGIETYTISQGKTNGPKMTKAVIDPHDPNIGVTQKFTLFVNHTKPVTIAKITLISDNKTKTYNLKLSEGTPLNGQWSGSWKIDDTHNQIYSFGIEIGDGTYTSKNTITIR